MSIRTEETDDGWTIEVTGKLAGREAYTERHVQLAVAVERARCLAWANSFETIGTTWRSVCTSIREGSPAPDESQG